MREFAKPQTDPSCFYDPKEKGKKEMEKVFSTTLLSPYLKFGCVSPRSFFFSLHEIVKEKKSTQPPESLLGQLYWREFFYLCSHKTEKFHEIEGNEICRKIEWDTNQVFLKAFNEAKTGYPWIDAILIQLRQFGWIHHLARHSVACFLTRGDLYLSWVEGVKLFDKLLLDADYALNNANWMWLSASAFFNQYWRVYSPVAFGKKYDPEGNMVKFFIPALKKFPKQYIYEPWKAPLAKQREWGCVIGQDYPKRIVDHDQVKDINLERMKAAFASKNDNKKRSNSSKEGETTEKKKKKAK